MCVFVCVFFLHSVVALHSIGFSMVMLALIMQRSHMWIFIAIFVLWCVVRLDIVFHASSFIGWCTIRVESECTLIVMMSVIYTHTHDKQLQKRKEITARIKCP